MMPMIWLTSDLHFNHDKEFIWKARGFNSVQEMNSAIVERYREVVKPEDTIYILGDLMMGQKIDENLDLIKSLPGQIVIIRGNHDTDNRVSLYKSFGVPVYDALSLKYNGYHFYLSHYPTLTGNLEKESLKQCTLNLFGHTHQQGNFFYDLPYMYHVGVDSHNCYPVSIDTVIEDMKQKVQECKDML